MIDQRLVASALEAVDTTNFERFAQSFYGAIQDREFVPLGGIHDGGAEGFDAFSTLDPDVFTDQTASSFLQVSKQATTRKKIRDTLKRLRGYGRDPKVVTYITSQVVSDIDKEESLLTKELGCKIAIRDARFIEAYINSNTATQGAFESYLLPSISHLFSPGVSQVAKRVPPGVDHTLAVFLRQEVENRRSRNGLMESISDSLIIWALRDTDPDPSKGRLLKRGEILERIEQALPTSRAFIRGVMDHRLNILSSKDAPGGRQIRFYPKIDSFCLPYETRTTIAVENAEDDLIKLRVSCVFEDRLGARPDEEVEPWRRTIIDVCHDTLERLFEHQGLKVAEFVQNADVDDETFTNVADIATRCVDRLEVTSDQKAIIRRNVLMVLRGTFYRSSEVERIYLGKLSRTYVLMLLLKNEPRVIEYFSSMAGSFSLYVGSDIIIRALSELFLSEDSQSPINLLKILSDAGSRLILTQTTINEVESHIRRQIFEYQNVYEANEHRVTLESVEYVDRLLIRSYFYAKLAPVAGAAIPRSWYEYVSTFCNYNDIKRKRGGDELADYLIRRFRLVYESMDELMSGIDTDELAALTRSIRESKERDGYAKEGIEILAYNDALQVLRVYARRRFRGEHNPGNPFGFQTWWLTQDSKVRRAAAHIVEKNGGNRFMMRPELLLNYIGLAPSLEKVRESYQTVFPSALGVRLSTGIRDAEFQKVMRDAAEVSRLDDARAGAMITAFMNKLKNDAHKEFEVGW